MWQASPRVDVLPRVRARWPVCGPPPVVDRYSTLEVEMTEPVGAAEEGEVPTIPPLPPPEDQTVVIEPEVEAVFPPPPPPPNLVVDDLF